MSLRMRMLSCMEMMGQTKTDQGCLQLQTTPIRGVSYANRLMEEGFQDLFCHHRAEAISPSSNCTPSPNHKQLPPLHFNPINWRTPLPPALCRQLKKFSFHMQCINNSQTPLSLRPGGNQKFVCVFCDIWTRWESVPDQFWCFLSVYSSINLISLLPLSEFQNSVTQESLSVIGAF